MEEPQILQLHLLIRRVSLILVDYAVFLVISIILYRFVDIGVSCFIEFNFKVQILQKKFSRLFKIVNFNILTIVNFNILTILSSYAGVKCIYI